MTIAGEERQQWFDMEVVHNGNKFFEFQWETIVVNCAGSKKKRQTITLMLPKVGILQEQIGWREHTLNISSADTPLSQVFLSLSNQVFQPNRVLLSINPGAMGW